MITRQHLKSLFIGLFLVNALTFLHAEGDTGNKNSSSNFIPYSGKTIFQSLIRPDVLDLTLTMDLSTLVDNRNSGEYLPARLEYDGISGEEIVYEVKVRTRGRYRRKVCDFPPVKIKFPKKVLRFQGYAEFNTLKLVTHCMDGKEAANNNVMREYLAYKMYNELTDKSFQVQLVRISYKDTSGKMGKMKRYGFIIENTDEMASRINGIVTDSMNIAPEKVVAKDENLMAMYQYAIGNCDWSTMLNRNLKLVVSNTTGKIIPVPYDFDFAGIVDAHYAIPNVDLGHTSIKERAFLGNTGVEQKIKEQNRFLLRQRKAAMFNVIKNFKRLYIEERMEMEAYLDDFFDKMADL